jgi:hypothetical protein
MKNNTTYRNKKRKARNGRSRKNRKNRYQRGGNPIIEQTRLLFPEEEFDIVINTYGEEIIYSILNKDEDKTCATFREEGGGLHLEGLDKCKLRGGETLDRLAALAKNLGKKHITLDDASKFYECEIRIDIPTLFILATGESWYNKKGYKNTANSRDKKYNDHIIKSPFMPFISKCLSNLRSINLEENSHETLERKIADLARRIGIVTSMLEDAKDEETRKKWEKALERHTKNIQELQIKIENYDEMIAKINQEFDEAIRVFSDSVKLNEYIGAESDSIDVNNMTVQEFFTIIKNRLNEISHSREIDPSFKCTVYKWIGLLVGSVYKSEKIKYHDQLTLIIE